MTIFFLLNKMSTEEEILLKNKINELVGGKKYLKTCIYVQKGPTLTLSTRSFRINS